MGPDSLQQAWNLAERRHHAQSYYPGDRNHPVPYLYHLGMVFLEATGVADTFAATARQDLLVTAILHDVLEDTETTEAHQSERFGETVAHNVRALTKDERLPKAERMSDSLVRIAARGRIVATVKLCDRIANISQPAPADWDQARRKGYVLESRQILAALGRFSTPLAERLAEKIDAYELLPGADL